MADGHVLCVLCDTPETYFTSSKTLSGPLIVKILRVPNKTNEHIQMTGQQANGLPRDRRDIVRASFRGRNRAFSDCVNND